MKALRAFVNGLAVMLAVFILIYLLATYAKFTLPEAKAEAGTASPGPTKDPVRLEISVVRGLPRPALLTTFRNSESFAFADGSPEAAAFLARAGEEKPWERAAADEAAFPLSFPLTNGWSRNAGFLLGHGWWAETAGVPDFARRQEAWRAFAASLLPDGPDARRRIVGRILLDNDGGGIAESDIGSTPFTLLFTEGGPTNIAVRSHRRHVVEPGGPTVYVPASSSLARRLAELADETRPWDWKSSNIHAYAGNIVFGGAFASREWHWRGIWTPMAQRREPGFRRSLSAAPANPVLRIGDLLGGYLALADVVLHAFQPNAGVDRVADLVFLARQGLQDKPLLLHCGLLNDTAPV